MINVLLVIPSLRIGGAERVFALLAKYLDRDIFKVTLAVVDMNKAVFHKDLPSDVQLVDLRCSRVRYAVPGILRLIWKERPDILFSTLWYLNLLVAMFRFFLPRNTRHVARETSIVSQRLVVERQSRIWSRLYRIFYKSIPNIICQSHAMKVDLVDNFSVPVSNLVVINNPVDIDLIRRRSNEGCPLIDGLRLKNRTVLIAVGRLSRAKGFDILLRAVSMIDDMDLHLVIVGDGPLRLDIEKQVIDQGLAGIVSIVGFQQNPYSWMANADAVILSSRYEGFPNVALEALACGTPVISTPAPGGAREILHGVDGCFIADELTPESLAKAILNWLSSSRQRIPLSVVQKYGLGRIMDDYSHYFQSMIHGAVN